MSRRPFVHHLGGIVVAVGVGAALAVGGAGGIAVAEPSAPGSPDTSASVDDGHKAQVPKRSKKKPQTGDKNDEKADKPAEKSNKPDKPEKEAVEPGGDPTPDDTPRADAVKDHTRDATVKRKKKSPVADAPVGESKIAKTPGREPKVKPKPKAAVPAAETPEIDTVDVALRKVDAPAERHTPVVKSTVAQQDTPARGTDVVAVLATSVLSFVDSVLKPASTTTPGAPADTPAAWAALAFSRREFDRAVTSSSLAGTRATTEIAELATVPAVLTDVERQVESAPLSFTASPNLLDQATVLGLRALRLVSTVIGVDIYSQISVALESASPPPFTTIGLDATVSDHEFADGTTWKVWTVKPPAGPGTGQVVVAMHGGTVTGPSLQHWLDYTAMARDTGATVIVPIYPTASTEAGRATVVVPKASEFIAEQVEANPGAVSVYADGMGAALALAAVQTLPAARRPESMVLLSPMLDISRSNPNLAFVDDPVAPLSPAAPHWADGVEVTDPLVSPLYGSFTGLPPITVYTGSLETAAPDALALAARTADAPVTVVIGQGQIRGWALAGLPTNSQASLFRSGIYRQLGLIAGSPTVTGPTTPATPVQVSSMFADSVSFTADPTLLDQVTVLGLRGLRLLSSAIGADVYGLIGRSLATDAPPFFTTIGLDASQTEHIFDDGTVWKVWHIAPPAGQESGKYVIALHGGGFVLQPILLQWLDYASMARDTGATVIVPMYPLATTEAGRASVVVPNAAEFIADYTEKHPGQVSVHADSAGASMALSAVQVLVASGRPVPESMVLLSPAVGGLVNPYARLVDDPVIDVATVFEGGQVYGQEFHWNDGLDVDDPFVAPLFGDFTGFPPTTIYHGALEFSGPDLLLLHEKARAQGAPVDVVIGVGQFHDWPLSGLPTNSQAPVVRQDIYRQLGLLEDDPALP